MRIPNQLVISALMLSFFLGFGAGLRAPTPAAQVATPSSTMVDPDRSAEILAEHLSAKYRKDRETVTQIVEAAFVEAAKHSISPLLVLAVIEQESSFRETVASSYGAMGLMQVVPRWHPEKLADPKNPSELLNPLHNVRIGTQVLAEYLGKKGGDLPAALKQYSGSATAYYEKVLRKKEALRSVLKRAEDQQSA